MGEEDEEEVGDNKQNHTDEEGRGVSDDNCGGGCGDEGSVGVAAVSIIVVVGMVEVR